MSHATLVLKALQLIDQHDGCTVTRLMDATMCSEQAARRAFDLLGNVYHIVREPLPTAKVQSPGRPAYIYRQPA